MILEDWTCAVHLTALKTHACLAREESTCQVDSYNSLVSVQGQKGLTIGLYKFSVSLLCTDWVCLHLQTGVPVPDPRRLDLSCMPDIFEDLCLLREAGVYLPGGLINQSAYSLPP